MWKGPTSSSKIIIIEVIKIIFSSSVKQQLIIEKLYRLFIIEKFDWTRYIITEASFIRAAIYEES